MTGTHTLVLEILKQDNGLSMSAFEQGELASTLRHYSRLDVSFAEIERLCQDVVLTLNKADGKGIHEEVAISSLKKTGQLLWDELLTRPVKNTLKSASPVDLILSLDEDLINIPWELLYDGKDFLSLKFNLGRVVRTKQQTNPIQYRSFSERLKMLVLANPTNDLQSAYLEGIFIKSQFDRRRKEISIDFKSTNIDKIYVRRNLRDYDIVHFAGHCEYDKDDAGNTGWVLNDGRFTAQDIQTMSQGSSLPSLVFSNACYSAKMRPEIFSQDCQERTYTLASAFLFSGVRHYIGAVRKIEDTLSITFAKEFYLQLISGKSVGESLRLARLKLIKEYGTTNISWAGYLLYGDPSYILCKTKAAAKLPRVKRQISKKTVITSSVALAIVAISIYLYMWLPTLNPSTYFTFRRSQEMFLKGRNQQVLSLTEGVIKEDPFFLAAYPLMGDTYHRMGDKRNALKYYFEYALYSEKNNDKKNLASAYLGIGWLYHLYGESQKAFDFYNKALVLSQENKDKLNEADALGKMAIWYMDKDNNDKALELLTKSAEINRVRQNVYKHRYNLACDYFNLGLLFTNKDDLASAKEFYDKSFKLFEKLKLKHELSDCYFNLGEIYIFQKEYQKAMDSYNKGLKLDTALGNKFNLASDYNMIGELHLEMDNFSEAEKYFSQAATLSKEDNFFPELAASYDNLGLLYKHKNQQDRAREYFRQAQEIKNSIEPLD